MLAFCPFYEWILDSVYKHNNVNLDEFFAKVEGHIHSALYIIHL